MELEKEKTVNNFEELGCFDPFDTDRSLEKANNYIAKLDIKNEVYKGFLTKTVLKGMGRNERLKPPACVFSPS